MNNNPTPESHASEVSQFLSTWRAFSSLVHKLSYDQFQALTQSTLAEWVRAQWAMETLSSLSGQQWEQLLFPALAIAPHQEQMGFPASSLNALEYPLHATPGPVWVTKDLWTALQQLNSGKLVKVSLPALGVEAAFFCPNPVPLCGFQVGETYYVLRLHPDVAVEVDGQPMDQEKLIQMEMAAPPQLVALEPHTAN